MLGVGVGFDNKGADKGFTIYNPKMPLKDSEGYVYQIPDTREGWVESVVMQINSYLKPDQKFVEFDYSLQESRSRHSVALLLVMIRS